MSLQLGTVHLMKVKEKLNDKFMLAKGSYEVELPIEGNENLVVSDEVQVFIYKNREEKVVASTKIPHVIDGVYDWAEVVDVIPRLGIFVNIGTDVEVLVPNSELPTYERARPLPGDKLYVTLTLDKQERLLCYVAKEATFDDVIRVATDVNLNDKVNGPIIRTDREGAVILTEEGYRGFIHHSEREREPRLGQVVTGRVIEVKENGTINVSLLPMKHERLD